METRFQLTRLSSRSPRPWLLLAGNPRVLGEDVLIVPAVLSDDARLSAAAEKANAMIGCDVILKDSMNGTVMSEVTGSDVSAWIYFDENLEPALDESAMNAWVQEVAASFNTVGTTRTYTRPDGKTVTAEGGDYGWAVDADSLTASLKDAVLNATVGEITVPCSSTGNGYTKAGRIGGRIVTSTSRSSMRIITTLRETCCGMLPSSRESRTEKMTPLRACTI